MNIVWSWGKLTEQNAETEVTRNFVTKIEARGSPTGEIPGKKVPEGGWGTGFSFVKIFFSL